MSLLFLKLVTFAISFAEVQQMRWSQVFLACEPGVSHLLHLHGVMKYGAEQAVHEL